LWYKSKTAEFTIFFHLSAEVLMHEIRRAEKVPDTLLNHHKINAPIFLISYRGKAAKRLGQE